MMALCILRLLFLELRGVCAIQSSGFWTGGPMATYWPTEQREFSRATRGLRRHRDRSIPCDGWADVNTVCVLCGMTLVEPPFQATDYFDVIMRVGRPFGRAARLRHAG